MSLTDLPIQPSPEVPTGSTKPAKKGIPQWQAMSFVSDFLFSILVPTAGCAYLGRWIDSRYGTSPWAVILGLLLALVLVTIIVKQKAEKMRKLFYPDASS